MEEKADSLNQLMNDKAVYRTSPATPGLLKKYAKVIQVMQQQQKHTIEYKYIQKYAKV